MSNIHLYLICEGTSCDFVAKSMKKVNPVGSSLSDFGLIESFYFAKNSRNTAYFQDTSSLFMVSAKGSSIDSALLMFGNQMQRKLYPVPYTSSTSRVETKADLRQLMDTFGTNRETNDYMRQDKFDDFSGYLPSTNVLLDWKYCSMNNRSFSRSSPTKFLTMIQKIRQQNQNVRNIFLVCDAAFIVEMMNQVPNNGYVSRRDMVEHTSFWHFEIQEKKSFLGNSLSIQSRNKIYPLARNMGYLKNFEKLFYYEYRGATVPLFHFNFPIPKIYLKKKYLTICSAYLTKDMRNEKEKREESSEEIVRPNSERKHMRMSNILRSFKKD